MKDTQFDLLQCDGCNKPFGILANEIPKYCPYCGGEVENAETIDENVEFNLLTH